jgi:lysophospholipase L1-like esterase
MIKKEMTEIIDADNPNIQYMGRFNFSNIKKVTFDWPGVCISANFTGTSLSVRLEDGKNEYAVIVDNYAPRILSTDTSKIYKVISGLADSISHTIIIQKRTETFVGKGVFSGFILDPGSILLQKEKRPERRIEFIGNSITCGFGDEGETADCHFSPITENANMSYAAITSRALNADYSMIAYSGRGVVRNYGDTNKTSRDPMPSLYDRTCFYDSTTKWNFSSWIPQVVVINLGTNDFSTKPFPDKDVFQKGYLDLVNRVRALYPGVTIFCIGGPMTEEPCVSYVREVVTNDQKMKREKNLFFIEIKKSYLAQSDWGCDEHPNILGMQKMADIIIPTIKLRMNW